jgi:cytochrome c-type biogenesis protein CcmH/NrfF
MPRSTLRSLIDEPRFSVWDFFLGLFVVPIAALWLAGRLWAQRAERRDFEREDAEIAQRIRRNIDAERRS